MLYCLRAGLCDQAHRHMCSIHSLTLLRARGIFQNPHYITGKFASFAYVLVPKACKKKKVKFRKHL